ncbi:MAG: hypothetical protein RRB22_12760 [Gammaproteobacteria bacterium]|nr:hypothetical protein [Gammaproteobacteria bacterium]
MVLGIEAEQGYGEGVIERLEALSQTAGQLQDLLQVPVFFLQRDKFRARKGLVSCKAQGVGGWVVPKDSA